MGVLKKNADCQVLAIIDNNFGELKTKYHEHESIQSHSQAHQARERNCPHPGYDRDRNYADAFRYAIRQWR